METGHLNIDHIEEYDESENHYATNNDFKYSNIQDDEFNEDKSNSYIVLEDSSDSIDQKNFSQETAGSSINDIENTAAKEIPTEDKIESLPINNAVTIEKDEIEKVQPDDTDIVGGPYSRETYKPSNPRKINEDTYKNVTVSTQYVARVLNVTEQTVRNYCRDFADYLNIETTGAGRMRFTNDDIEHLRHIMRLKDENNFTMDQLKEYLANPDNYSRLPETERLDMFASQLEERVLALITKQLSSTTAALIESNDKSRKQENEQITKLMEAFNEQSAELKQLKDEMDKIDSISKTIDIVKDKIGAPNDILNEYQSKIDRLLKEIERLSIDNANMDKIVKEQEQTITELNAAKKKKKFFGLI